MYQNSTNEFCTIKMCCRHQKFTQTYQVCRWCKLTCLAKIWDVHCSPEFSKCAFNSFYCCIISCDPKIVFLTVSSLTLQVLLQSVFTQSPDRALITLSKTLHCICNLISNGAKMIWVNLSKDKRVTGGKTKNLWAHSSRLLGQKMLYVNVLQKIFW